jgi:hypothetical protein
MDGGNAGLARSTNLPLVLTYPCPKYRPAFRPADLPFEFADLSLLWSH